MSATREQQVTDTFVELADTLSSEYDIGDFLQTLVDRCGQVLEVETVGVLIEGPEGTLRLAAATSEAMKELEELELSSMEGPCLEAYRKAEQVVFEDLRTGTDRWPNVAPAALDMGLLAAYAFPVRLRGDCIGALNLYRQASGVFRDDDIRLAQAFADVAAIGILQERKVADAQERATQLQKALDSRVVIEQAKGVLAERHGVSPEQAFAALRGFARSRNRKLHEVCQVVIAGSDEVGAPAVD